MKIVIINANDSAAFKEPTDLGEFYRDQSYRRTMTPEQLAEVDAADVVLADFAPFGFGVMRARVEPFGAGIETKDVTAVEFSWFSKWTRREWDTFPEAPPK